MGPLHHQRRTYLELPMPIMKHETYCYRRLTGTRDKYQKGPCRPKMEITSRVVLTDPVLQEHREHMGTYAIIYKFMGIWCSE